MKDKICTVMSRRGNLWHVRVRLGFTEAVFGEGTHESPIEAFRLAFDDLEMQVKAVLMSAAALGLDVEAA